MAETDLIIEWYIFLFAHDKSHDKFLRFDYFVQEKLKLKETSNK